MKKVLFISDLHCGHLVGLTPPGFQAANNPTVPKKRKVAAVQRDQWDTYKAMVDKERPFDVIICVGDCIDGKGQRSGGTELLTTDRGEQGIMATYAIKEAMSASTKVAMVYGTPYHTGVGEDWEDKVAEEVGAKRIGSHIFPEVEGVIFDVKHHVGGSSVPHGRATAIKREKLWNLIWSERNEQPNAQVLVRGHVHYHEYAGNSNSLCFTMPALQGYGSKFGKRRCSGTVDFGMVVFDVHEGEYKWRSLISRLPVMRATTLLL